MAEIPRVPVEKQITILSVVKIAIKFSTCTLFIFHPFFKKQIYLFDWCFWRMNWMALHLVEHCWFLKVKASWREKLMEEDYVIGVRHRCGVTGKKNHHRTIHARFSESYTQTRTVVTSFFFQNAHQSLMISSKVFYFSFWCFQVLFKCFSTIFFKRSLKSNC